MKKKNIAFGMIFILIATIVLLDAIGIISSITNAIGGLSVISILLGILLIAVSVYRIINRDFSTVIIALALMFMLFEKNIAFIFSLSDNIVNNWLLLLSSVIFAVGMNFIIPKNSKGHSTKFSDSTVYLDSMDLHNEKYRFIKNTFGDCKIYFENCDEYKGGGTLSIANRFGEMEIFIPSGWHLTTNIECIFGENDFPECVKNENAPMLNIVGSNKFGEVKIIYV